MADLKISQLTGATTPLAGTEVLPIVQSSSTKKVAVSDLTAGRAVSMGTAEVTGASTKLSAEVFRTSATSYMRIAGGSAAAAGAYVLAFGESHASAPGRLSLNAAGTGYAELASGDGSYNFRLSSTGNATLSNGNLALGTANKALEFSGNGSVIWRCGAGTPEGAVTAPVGSLFTRTDGGVNTTLYVKESGTGNTGWAAK